MLTLSHNKISRQSLLFIIKNYGHGSFNPQPKKKRSHFSLILSWSFVLSIHIFTTQLLKGLV